MLKRFYNRPIIVTGSHRSGSTWLGKMLSLTDKIKYVHEPFNKNYPLNSLSPIKYWFEYITDSDSFTHKNQFIKYLDAIIGLPYQYFTIDLIKAIVKLKPKMLKNKIRLIQIRLTKRYLIKDPICLFSVDWIARKYHADVVVIIRHPAAFVASIKVKDWNHDFNNFFKQKKLIKEVLKPFESEIQNYANKKHDIIDQGIMMWNLIHYRIKDYQNKHKNWIFIRHEDISVDPIEEFSKLYKNLKIKNFDLIKDEIINHSKSDKGDLYRNSKENISSWKNRLSEEEISRIKIGTKEISKHFYTDNEW
ncbi:sulfotransferase [uncultured Algibacter sp.]|uniref:sulfotransferase n=1 Tax=uncultured Algibacter sp. TaxID=298659 RepID=UPI00261734EE|nr:sulfotransferase [uncultured Algibacter sp.]